MEDDQKVSRFVNTKTIKPLFLGVLLVSIVSAVYLGITSKRNTEKEVKNILHNCVTEFLFLQPTLIRKQNSSIIQYRDIKSHFEDMSDADHPITKASPSHVAHFKKQLRERGWDLYLPPSPRGVQPTDLGRKDPFLMAISQDGKESIVLNRWGERLR
jgi:hypothetical protein